MSQCSAVKFFFCTFQPKFITVSFHFDAKFKDNFCTGLKIAKYMFQPALFTSLIFFPLSV